MNKYTYERANKKLKILLILITIFMIVVTLQTTKFEKLFKEQNTLYNEQLKTVELKYQAEKKEHQNTKLELATAKRMLEDKDAIIAEIEQGVYAGTFNVSYYTAGPESTGKNPGDIGYGITKSGTTVAEGRTIAADWDVLEPGQTVWIENVGVRTVEDAGGLIRGNDIDVFVEDVDEAISRGRHTSRVYLLGED